MQLLYIIVVATSQKTNSNTSNKSQGRYQVLIIRELSKESPIYCYPIYIIDTWFMLAINNPILMSMYVICQVHSSRKYNPAVISSSNYTSPPFSQYIL